MKISVCLCGGGGWVGVFEWGVWVGVFEWGVCK